MSEESEKINFRRDNLERLNAFYVPKDFYYALARLLKSTNMTYSEAMRVALREFLSKEGAL